MTSLMKDVTPPVAVRIGKSLRVVGPALVAVVTGALALYVLGAAGTAVLASAWILGIGIARVAPELRGPAIWAAAAVAEFSIILGLGAALALLAPGPHGQIVWIAVLVAPAAIGVLLILAGRASRARSSNPVANLHGGLLLTITGLVLAGFAAIGVRGRSFDVAWAMSGDARNHALILRSILNDGGITLHSLRSYPAALNGFAATIAGVADRDALPGQLLLDDAHALAVTYVLCVVTVGALLAAAVLETLPASAHRRRLPISVAVIGVVVASGAATPLLLGTTLVDGFFSAYGALVPALAALVLALRFMRDVASRAWTLAAVSLATGLTFITWTVLVAVPFAALTVMVVVGARARLHGRGSSAAHSWWEVAWLAGAWLMLMGVVGVTIKYLPTFRQIFAFPGSIVAPAGWLLTALVLASAAIAFGGRDRLRRRQMLIPVVAALVGGLTVIALRLDSHGPGLGWSYYSRKMDWLVACCLVWVPFVPLAAWARRQDVVGAGRLASSRLAASLAAGAAALMLLLGTATSAPEPALLAARGWSQPSAAAVSETVRGANVGRPFVIWAWSDAGNDKLADFWAALAWASRDGQWLPGRHDVPQTFPVWAYFMDESQIDQLCEAAAISPGITVYTANKALASEFSSTCPSARATVVTEGNSP